MISQYIVNLEGTVVDANEASYPPLWIVTFIYSGGFITFATSTGLLSRC